MTEATRAPAADTASECWWEELGRAAYAANELERPGWWEQGACRTADPGINFFPEGREDPGPALAVCGDCPVQGACLDYAAGDPEIVGVWGGRWRVRAGAALRAPEPEPLATLVRQAVALRAMEHRRRPGETLLSSALEKLAAVGNPTSPAD